jgi:hypothetical protein
MIRKREIGVVAGTILMLTAGVGLALAHGFGGGPGPGGHEMWLLARAAGLNHDQIVSAFKSDAKIKTARDNLTATHEAMMSCVVSGADCSTQISAFSNALQTMVQERMTVWQNLFKSAPNASQAANVYSQLKQLQSQKKQILQSVLGSGQSDGSPGGNAWNG